MLSWDPISCSAALNACSEMAEWVRAMDMLWKGIVLYSCEVDVVCCNAAIATCSDSWTQAMALLSFLDANLQPTPISFNAGIAACAGCSQWSQAMGLLHAMQGAGWRQDILNLEAVVNSCATCGQFAPIPGLLRRLKRPLGLHNAKCLT